jgi:predicted dienelactone hydrolase
MCTIDIMPKTTKRRRRWGRGILLVLGCLLTLCGGYVALIAALDARTVDSPALTGPYGVGRVSFEWTDVARKDPLDTGGGPRKLPVWVWYPAPAQTQGARMKYTPGLWSRLAFGAPVGWFETSFDKIRVNAVADAQVADGKFPVVVLEPGMGFSAPQYTALAEDLASHGYIVAGLTPTYSANVSVLDGRVVPSNPQGNPPDLGGHSGPPQQTGDRLAELWAADAHFTADQVIALGSAGQFAARIDAKVAYVGHSFGGASSLEACRTDPRCAGAVDLDGTQFGTVVRAGLRKPFLILGSEDSCITGRCGPVGVDAGGEQDTAKTLLRASTRQHWLITISGAHHLNFTDYSLYFVAPPLHHLLGLGSIDGRRMLTIQNDTVTSFLDHAVRGADATSLDNLSTKYPETTVSH